MNKKTTLFDLMMSATSTAEDCIDENNRRKDDLAIASLKLEAFNAAGFDRSDYGTWANNVEDMIARIIVLKNTPSPATAAALSAQKQTNPS